MRRHVIISALEIVSCFTVVSCVFTQTSGAASPAQQVLTAASGEQKFVFLVFYKVNDAATQAMAQAIERGVESRSNRATFAFVQITNPAEKALVDRFGVSRACSIVRPYIMEISIRPA